VCRGFGATSWCQPSLQTLKLLTSILSNQILLTFQIGNTSNCHIVKLIICRPTKILNILQNVELIGLLFVTNISRGAYLLRLGARFEPSSL
jgi:hypothetical protein